MISDWWDYERARSFRDLRVYQLARTAAGEVFEVSKGFPREERYAQRIKFVGRRARPRL